MHEAVYAGGPAEMSETALSAPLANEQPSAWRGIVQLLVNWRVRITVIGFLLLISEDVITGIKPHDLMNYRDFKSVLGLVLVFAGLALRSWAAGTLHKWSQLTTVGPYKIIRHPLYVGSFMMMVGFCELIDDPENIFFVLGPLVLLYFLKIRNEERHLFERFGDRWTAYANSTPRFFARRLPSNILPNWSFSQWLGNREYQAFGASLVGLIAIEMWQRM
jgi:protein-S-isoprenylcysteine O-methyltransferase Ste14